MANSRDVRRSVDSRKSSSWLKSICAASAIACAAPVHAENPHPDVPPLTITINDRPTHPSVYLTREDFEAARQRAATYDWAKKAAEDLLAEADRWVAKPDEEILKLIPPAASTYAYGHAGCPVCGGAFAGWWGANGTASLSDPGHVRCVNGHRLPDEAHPDNGPGWIDPASKKAYHFVATFNSYAIDALSTAMIKLALAYGLTNDERYAAKAAFIFDHLAAIYPTSDVGSIDYPSPEPSGRFNRPWYQVARMLVHYANVYDILRMGNILDKPSCVAGMTRRQNIETNLLLNGALYCYQQAVDTPALHNGTADYQRGQMAVAAAMGIPEYMEYAVDSAYGFRNMVENNIDRDGQYYETSSEYSSHARLLYLDMADILKHYRDTKQPGGYDVVQNPKFRAMLMLSRSRLEGSGVLITLGDDLPKVARADPRSPERDLELFEMERLAALTDDKSVAQLIAQYTGGEIDRRRASANYKEWLLFHAVDVPAPSVATNATTQAAQPVKSALIAQRGLAILRDGDADDSAALSFRAGPTLNHGHFDEMGINVYSRGYQLSYDIGYVFGSTHAYQGFGHQTASHNLVLVNETSQLKAGVCGGSVDSFVTLPGMTFTRGSNPMCYAGEKVTQYDRSVMLVAVEARSRYALDIFRVEGGHQHDYIFHGQGTDIHTEGLELSAPEEGSLAGKDVRWGELIGPDGNVSTEPNRPNWNPPPGNGMGFLMRPRRANQTNVASVTWRVADDAHLRIDLLRTQDQQVILADAPGLYRDPKYPSATYMLARRTGTDLHSVYAAVIEPYGTQRSVRSVCTLATESKEAIGVRVDLPNSTLDVLLQSDTPATWNDGDRYFSIDRGTARIRFVAGQIDQIDLLEGSSLQVDSLRLTLPASSFSGRITRVDGDTCTLRISGKLPELSSGGYQLSVGRAEYSHRAMYEIDRIEQSGDESIVHLTPTTFVLGRGHLASDPPDGHTLPNVVPMEYAKSVQRVPSGYFAGKRVRVAGRDVSTRMINIEDPLARVMHVEDSRGFRAGDDLVVEDIQEGDDVRLDAAVSIRRDGNGWITQGNTEAMVSTAVVR